ncbi:MAG: response regulator transcription factor [Candidatus Acidiferrales bacterium]
MADDDVIASHGLRASLTALSGVEVCGEVRTEREAMRLATEMNPDLVILALNLREAHGVEVARTIRRELPGTEVLIVTPGVSPDLAWIALRAGARGYVTKTDSCEELATAVYKVCRQEPHLTTSLPPKTREEIIHIARHAVPDSELTLEVIASVLVRSEMKLAAEVEAMLRRRQNV